MGASDMNIAMFCGELPDGVASYFNPTSSNSNADLYLSTEMKTQRKRDLERVSFWSFDNDGADSPSKLIYRHKYDPPNAKVVMLPDGFSRDLDVSDAEYIDDNTTDNFIDDDQIG